MYIYIYVFSKVDVVMYRAIDLDLIAMCVTSHMAPVACQGLSMPCDISYALYLMLHIQLPMTPGV